MEVIGIAFLALMAMNIWIVGGALIGLFVLMIFANDEDPGLENVLGLVIFGGIGYLVWGKIALGAALLGVLYYILIGGAWSIFNYTRTIRKKMQSDKDNGTRSSLKYYQSYIDKNRIVRWIAYWPLSIVNYIVGDFIVSILRILADWLGNTYKKITTYFYNKMFGDMEETPSSIYEDLN